MRAGSRTLFSIGVFFLSGAFIGSVLAQTAPGPRNGVRAEVDVDGLVRTPGEPVFANGLTPCSVEVTIGTGDGCPGDTAEPVRLILSADMDLSALSLEVSDQPDLLTATGCTSLVAGFTCSVSEVAGAAVIALEPDAGAMIPAATSLPILDLALGVSPTAPPSTVALTPQNVEATSGATVCSVTGHAGAVVVLSCSGGALLTDSEWRFPSLNPRIAGAGDVNHDGYADVVVGLPDALPGGRGELLLFLGSASPLSAAPTSRISGDGYYLHLGSAVAAAGDWDLDGYDDVLVATGPNPDDYSELLVLAGAPAGLAGTLWSNPAVSPLATFAGAVDFNGNGTLEIAHTAEFGLHSPLNDVVVWIDHGVTHQLYDVAPSSVAIAGGGDLDGDGTDELLACETSTNGRCRVWYGYFGGLGGPGTAFGPVGARAFAAGDVNADGYDDVIATLPGASQEGTAILYLGSMDGLHDLSPVWTASGEHPGALFGKSFSSAGDVDGDGHDDVLVGSPDWTDPRGGTRQGRAYLYRGVADGLQTTPGFVATGQNSQDMLGVRVAGAGDVDADGFADVLLGMRTNVQLYLGGRPCPDLDGDGYGAGPCAIGIPDCDDQDPFCAVSCTDADGDGRCPPLDCDDSLSTCVANCIDVDGDGVPTCAADCDDSRPHCTADCTDADGDDWCAPHDCDDAKPLCTTSCTDTDQDGWCPPLDCDDTTATCFDDCSDADGDGLRVCEGDCDDSQPLCTTDCTDADGDGWCTTFDCNDSNPECRDDCTDADGDGSCSPFDCSDTNPQCGSSCLDADGDTWCFGIDCDDTHFLCTTDCSDADGDGVAACFDCNDGDPQCGESCTDADGDGWCQGVDCNDTVAGCSTDCTDGDGDGLPICANDCDDANALCGLDCTDADADGRCPPFDCYDLAAACTTSCTDLDGDGIPTCAPDCNDANPRCAFDCTDADDDGWCPPADCDDLHAGCSVGCVDADQDGTPVCAGDCNDGNPHCGLDCADADHDGWCAPADCDEAKPHCGPSCADADGDGWCPPFDCDDASSTCTAGCADLDEDGVPPCGGDCDDTSPAVSPLLAETCGDGADNDCNGFADAADEACPGLAAGEVRFETKERLTWNSGASADAQALYRGTIPATGFRRYDHRCWATELSEAWAVDSTLPPRGEGFYYLATGLSIGALPARAIVGGWLGSDSAGRPRPDAPGGSCGARVYVDPDVVGGERTGLSWADAYTSVARALGHPGSSGRGLEVWLHGTAPGSALLHGALRPAAVLLGGFAGDESLAWERDPAASPTIWRGGHFLLVETVSVVLDGLTLRETVMGVQASGSAVRVELRNVAFEEIGQWAVDLTASGLAGSHLRLDGVTAEDAGAGAVRAVSTGGVLEGSIRRSRLASGSDAAIRLEARPGTIDATVAVDIVGNTVSGGGAGIVLGAHVANRPRRATQASFVASNVIHGGSGPHIVVEATGSFTGSTGAATALAAPLVVGNTLADGGAAGVDCRASRSDTTGLSALHVVRAVPELWDNLITSNAGAGIVESTDAPAAGLVADPLVIGNDLYDNAFAYLDEGGVMLTSAAEVNALDEASDNLENDPFYVDASAGDYHLRRGTVLGASSAFLYLANESDPGIGTLWTAPGFDDGDWDPGRWSIGFDGAPDTDPPATAGSLETVVPAGSSSVYVRTVFDVPDSSQVSMLRLGLDYDDGCIVWINGVEIFRTATMPPGEPAWNTVAAPHESSNASVPVFEEYDVSAAAVPHLVDGTNVLALGVWNESAASPDLLLVPRLVLNDEYAAIDQGHLEGPRRAAEDLDGGVRVVDGDGDGVSRPDIGADER